jgi:uroporphyrinogen decarboxylase
VGTMHADMSYRERFTRTLAHQDVDRPPMDLDGTDMTGIDGGPGRLAPLLGVRIDVKDPEETREAVRQALDIDIRDVGGILEPSGSLARRVSDTEMIDAWGITYRHNGHHFEAVGRPLAGAGIDDLARYPWPDPDKLDPAAMRRLAGTARHYFEETPYVVCARHPYFGVLELGCWMCGFDDFLYRMAGEPEFVDRFFQIILNYQHRVDEIYYAAVGPYIHFTTSGDDFGSQNGPLISPSMFRSLIHPFLSKRISHIRQFTDAAFFHHSCGAIRPLIPALIDAGVDILNPLQPQAAGMEPEGLKRDFGRSLTFYGGMDTQRILPQGTPEEVAAETRRVIGALGGGGGYILSAAHHLQSDVPAGNVIAMYREGGSPGAVP